MDPLHQFEIQYLVEALLLTNSGLWMLLAVITSYSLMMLATSKPTMVPGRLQLVAEMLYSFVVKMVNDNAGDQARPFIPFIFSLFMFILFGNLLGLIPGSFTFTSHIIVTFGLALMVITVVTILGFVKHGLHFLELFVPKGVSVYIAVFLVPIELISYLTRPVSLSVRLFANMMAGHAMLKVFAGFSVLAVGALGTLGGVIGLLPMLINVLLTGFELLVAVLQAYVFSVLSCLYIRDALELH